MTRYELARILLILTMVSVGLLVAYLAILYRERRRRAHWSTRNRAAHPHWSLTFATRVERSIASVSAKFHRRRNRNRRRHRKRNL